MVLDDMTLKTKENILIICTCIYCLWLYQMEYCEKSTLRNCIDAGLYQTPDRLWRLFREIVEGLVHIHEQVRQHTTRTVEHLYLHPPPPPLKLCFKGFKEITLSVRSYFSKAQQMSRYKVMLYSLRMFMKEDNVGPN